MNGKVLDFLNKNRISCLTTLLSDGTPHSATLHYAYDVDGQDFYFITEKESRKMGEVNSKGSSKASLVIGFSETEFTTLQMEGEIKTLNSADEIDKAFKIYDSKYKGSDTEEGRKNTKYVFIRFIPDWWRYTDLKQEPYIIVSSEDK